MFWRAQIILQPWRGLLVSAGYELASLHGTAAVPPLATAIGMPIPEGVALASEHFEMSSRLHLFEAEVGWEWRWHRHWSIRIELGAAVTRTARSRLALQPATDNAQLHDVAVQATAKLDHAFTAYIKTPLLSSFIAYEL
ncbi:hypothetical protein BH11MYX1_BH11MYX1_29010 [soil metagenome]